MTNYTFFVFFANYMDAQLIIFIFFRLLDYILFIQISSSFQTRTAGIVSIILA